MALNFPDFPIIGEIYTDETSGFSYKWDGKVWKSFSYDTESSIYLIDDISSLFDGINRNFELRNNGSLFYPSVSHQLVISLDGALQAPNQDYGISGSNITFSQPPAFGTKFSGISLGIAFPIKTPYDGLLYEEQDFLVTDQTQSVFNFNYSSDYLDVYKNGVKLVKNTDFVAISGNSFSLATPAVYGDIISAKFYYKQNLFTSTNYTNNIIATGDAYVEGIGSFGGANKVIIGGITTSFLAYNDAYIENNLKVKESIQILSENGNLTTKNLTADNLTTNNLSISTITSDTGFISTITSDTGFISSITSDVGFIDTIFSNDALISNIVSDTSFISTITTDVISIGSSIGIGINDPIAPLHLSGTTQDVIISAGGTIGFGTDDPISSIHLAGPDGCNIYLDAKGSAAERQIVFDNGTTYGYFYINKPSNPYGESLGWLDQTLNEYGTGSNRNLWYYSPPRGTVIIGDTITTDIDNLKVGIGSTQPEHSLDVAGTTSSNSYITSGIVTTGNSTSWSVDASLTGHMYAEFSESVEVQIYNLFDGAEFKMFVNNTANVSKVLTVKAKADAVSAYSNVRIAQPTAYNDNLTTITLGPIDVRLITVMNIGGNFVGGC